MPKGRSGPVGNSPDFVVHDSVEESVEVDCIYPHGFDDLHVCIV